MSTSVDHVSDTHLVDQTTTEEPRYTTKVTTTQVIHKKHRTTANVLTSTLSIEQIQILQCLIFAVNFDEYDDEGGFHKAFKLQYQLDGNSMSNTDVGDSFTWDSGAITHTLLSSEGTVDATYHVNMVDGYMVWYCEEDDHKSVTITLKDGQLESMGDQPAIKVLYCGSGHQTHIWFHHNRCFRAANPQLPSRINSSTFASTCYHHDANGRVFRDPKDGVAIYELTLKDGVEVAEPVEYLIEYYCKDSAIRQRHPH